MLGVGAAQLAHDPYLNDYYISDSNNGYNTQIGGCYISSALDYAAAGPFGGDCSSATLLGLTPAASSLRTPAAEESLCTQVVPAAATWADGSLDSPASCYSLSEDRENDPYSSLHSGLSGSEYGEMGGEVVSDTRLFSGHSASGLLLRPGSTTPPSPGACRTRGCQAGRRGHQRQAANVRERRRMRTINDAFESLRVRVPTACDDRKMSKVDTLKMAIKYIHELRELLKSVGDSSLPGTRPNSNNKIVVTYATGFGGEGNPEDEAAGLYGHSLSWHDTRQCAPVINHRLRAPLWVPHNPTPEDIANMVTDT